MIETTLVQRRALIFATLLISGIVAQKGPTPPPPAPSSDTPLTSAPQSYFTEDGSLKCTLKQKEASQAYPSLKQCYIYTRSSCCTSVHDGYIQGELENLVSDSCMDNFDALTQYFCFGCFAKQSSYLNYTTRTIRVCKDFAARVWSGGNPDIDTLSQPSSAYDNCGLHVNSSIKIQSQAYKNATYFFKDVLPPFFENYQIELVDGLNNCYDWSMRQIMQAWMVASVLLLLVWV